MNETIQTKTYAGLSEEELVRLVFSEADRLPKGFSDEVISRGQRVAPLLAGVIQDRKNWFRDDSGWWSSVHATLLLRAFGGESAVPALDEAWNHAVAKRQCFAAESKSLSARPASADFSGRCLPLSRLMSRRETSHR